MISVGLGAIACGSGSNFGGGGGTVGKKSKETPDKSVESKRDTQAIEKKPNPKKNTKHAIRLGKEDKKPSFIVETAEDTDHDSDTDSAVADITATLENLRWNFPCSGPGFGICGSPSQLSVQKPLAGDPNLLYSIELRFRGIVETKAYSGGSNDGSYFQIGGSPVPGLANIYQLEISDPPQTYYLNRQSGFGDKLALIDFTKTVEVYGGATVRLFADAVDSLQLANNASYVVPGVEDTPYNGQFIQMNVVSISASKP